VTPGTNIPDLPKAEGTPTVLIEEAKPFTVTVTFVDGVYSTRDDTALVIETGNGVLTGTTTASVLAGQSSVIFDNLLLETANRVVLTARPVDRKAARDLGSGSSEPFDVVADPVLVPVTDKNRPPVISKTGYGTACEPTPEVPSCVDVLLPNGLYSNVFFSTGTCGGSIGCRDSRLDVLQVLADLGGMADSPNTAKYTKTSPATLVVKCDKELCGGGAIQRNVLRASLDPTGDLATVPACAAKGVIDADPKVESCVDFVQSKRDGSGDTYLYWLVTRDARMSIG